MSWEEHNAHKRLQEERAKLGISGPMAQPRPGGPMAQRATPDVTPRSTSLSDHKPAQIPPLTVTDGPVGHRPASEPVGHRPKKDTRVRPHLDIRLPNGSLDVERIVANWTAEKKAAPNVVAAIRLMDAILNGNLDYVRENYPMMVEGLQKSQKRRVTPSLKESDSYKEREPEKREDIEPAVEQIAEALQKVTGRDRHLNRDVYELAADLHRLDYTAPDIDVWHKRCWPTSWPGDKGETPSLKLVRERIGQVRNLPVDQQGQPEPNPYWDDPYFTRHTDSDLPPVEKMPVWPPSGCSVPARIRDVWNIMHSQTSSAIGWRGALHYLKDMKPIHYDAALGTLYVSTFRLYQKEWADEHWFDRHRQFNNTLSMDEYLERMTVGKPGERQLRIEFIVEGDPVPGIDTR